MAHSRSDKTRSVKPILKCLFWGDKTEGAVMDLKIMGTRFRAPLQGCPEDSSRQPLASPACRTEKESCRTASFLSSTDHDPAWFAGRMFQRMSCGVQLHVAQPDPACSQADLLRFAPCSRVVLHPASIPVAVKRNEPNWQPGLTTADGFGLQMVRLLDLTSKLK